MLSEKLTKSERAAILKKFLQERRFQRYLRTAPFDEHRKAHKKAHGTCGKICRWCGGQITGRRTSWCSNACDAEFSFRLSSPRYAVGQRDNGVCALCGLDVPALQDAIEGMRVFYALFGVCRKVRHIDRDRISGSSGDTYWARRPQIEMDHGVLCECPACQWKAKKVWWEADHIVPVAEGGGCCGLEGYRTLCFDCHLVVTKELRQRLKEKKSEKPKKGSH